MARRLTGEQLQDALVARGMHWQYANAVLEVAREDGAFRAELPPTRTANPLYPGQTGFTVRYFRKSGRFVLKFKEAE